MTATSFPALRGLIWSKMPPVAKCSFCASFQPPKCVDRHQLDLRELAGVFRGDRGIARPVEIPRGDLLALGRIQELADTPRADDARAAPQHDLVDHGHRRFREHADRRHDDFESARCRVRAAPGAPRSPRRWRRRQCRAGRTWSMNRARRCRAPARSCTACARTRARSLHCRRAAVRPMPRRRGSSSARRRKSWDSGVITCTSSRTRSPQS